MNEQLLSRAAAILDYVGETVKKTGDFVVEQAPDIAIQYVAYARATSTTGIVIGLILLCTSIYGFCKLSKNEENAEFFFLGFFSGITSVIMLLANFNTFFMSWFAPKVYLLTEIVKLVK